MEDLIENLETILAEGEWALGADWTREDLQDRIRAMNAALRFTIDMAKDLALIRETTA